MYISDPGDGIAIPLGLMAAIFLSEYALAPAASVRQAGLELLAGIPTIVYGYFAFTSSRRNVPEVESRS